MSSQYAKLCAVLLLCVALTALASVSSLNELPSIISIVTTRSAKSDAGAEPYRQGASDEFNDPALIFGTKSYVAPDIKSLGRSFPREADIHNEALWSASVEHDEKCPLGRAFIIPSYAPHFRFLIEGLASIQHFVDDAYKFHYLVVVTDPVEKIDFEALLQLNKITLPIEVATLAQTLQDHYPEHKFVDDILPTILEAGVHPWFGKIKYQSWKKFYGALFSQCQRMYWLDSEFLAVKPMSFAPMFDQYFARRRFFYSIGPDFNRWPGHQALEMLGMKDDALLEGTWFHETFDWFIERDILLELMEHSETHSRIVRPETPYKVFRNDSSILPGGNDKLSFFEIGMYSIGPIFEHTLYQVYIWANRRKYPQFEWLYTRQVMSNILSATPNTYWEFDAGKPEITPAAFRRWQAAMTPGMGNFEFVLAGLNAETFDLYKEMVEFYHIWNFRTPPAHSLEFLCKLVMESDGLGLHVVDESGFPPPGAPNCEDVPIFRHEYIAQAPDQ